AESAPHEGRAGVGDACCDAGDVASMVLGRVRVKDGADRLGAEHLCGQDLVAGVEARRVNFVDGWVERVRLWIAFRNCECVGGKERMGCVDSRVEDSYLDSGACIALAADGAP